jgi:hypothetical protein
MESEGRFARYIESLAGVLGHVDRVAPLRDYCTGLLMPVERKSVEPMAAMVSPARASAAHQSLLHFIGQSAWSDETMLGKVRDVVAPTFEAHGSVEAWIVDDTGYQKKGSHSAGVARGVVLADTGLRCRTPHRSARNGTWRIPSQRCDHSCPSLPPMVLRAKRRPFSRARVENIRWQVIQNASAAIKDTIATIRLIGG